MSRSSAARTARSCCARRTRCPPIPRTLTERLAHWAREAPGAALHRPARRRRRLAQPELRRNLQARARLGQALLDRGLSQERPLAILSDNDIEHALLALACMHVGIAYVPVSSAYSLVSTDHAKLQVRHGLLTPGLVYAADGERFAKAIAAAVPAGTEVLTGADLMCFWQRPETLACGRGARRGRTGHDRQVPAHLGLDRAAQGRDQHAAHALQQPADADAVAALAAPRRRRCWWTGCPGTTPRAATTTWAWCSTTAARCTSTKASRCRD